MAKKMTRGKTRPAARHIKKKTPAVRVRTVRAVAVQEPTPIAQEVHGWMRRLMSRLPETGETMSWGHPNFTVAGKIFAAIEAHEGEWAMSFKALPELQRELVSDQGYRFYVAPHVGQHGWISMRIDGLMNWGLLKTLVLNSYRLVAPRRVLSRVTGSRPAPSRPRAQS
jgi:predicted DNA-binding protein (MmcQ/YjbR family)